MFLRFDGLMQAFGITAAEHEAAREFIDDDDFAVFDDIIAVADHQGFGFQGSHQLMGVIDAGFTVIHIGNAEQLFCLGDPFFRRSHGLLFFIDRIVLALFEMGNYISQYLAYGLHRSGWSPLHRRLHSGAGAAPSDPGKRPCCHADSRTRIRCSCRR